MRANEAQVAELTRKLGQLEMEKARLQSRTRLLEQVGEGVLDTKLCVRVCVGTVHHAHNVPGGGGHGSRCTPLVPVDTKKHTSERT